MWEDAHIELALRAGQCPDPSLQHGKISLEKRGDLSQGPENPGSGGSSCESASCSSAPSQEAQHVHLVVLVASSTHHILPALWLQALDRSRVHTADPPQPLSCPLHLAMLCAAGLLFLN